MSGLLQSTRFWVAAFVLYAGFAMLAVANGSLSGPNGLPVSNLQLHIFSSLLLFWVLYFLVRPFREAVRNADLFALTALQCFRVLGGAILIMWGYGLLPGGFALPMSLLDISVGVMAFFALRMMWEGDGPTRRFLQTLHIWSIADFFVTILLAMFAWRALAIDPSSNAAGYAQLVELPLAAFPTIAIPVFSWASFAALVRLKHLGQSEI